MPIWTEAQSKAIYEPSGDGNILVSAAAGSGKTAVLVERITNMMTRSDNPVSIDELLVVTFTEAAAAEMKERIMSSINDVYREAVLNGETEKSRYLREQMYMTASADINTIDSFCLSVVKNNFHVLGIDPNFSIMDKNEGSMLMDDTLTELFLTLYASEDKEEALRFRRLVRIYASNRDDEGLKSVILKIYNFIQSMPEPLEWLRKKADMYSEDMTQSVWVREIFLKRQINYIIESHEAFWNEMISDMLKIVSEKYGVNAEDYIAYEEIAEASEYWGRLWENVCKCAEAVKSLKSVTDCDGAYKFFKTYIEKKTYLGSAVHKKLPKKIASDEEWLRFYNRYDYMRDNFREECMRLPVKNNEEFNEYVHAGSIKQHVDDIVWLVQKFSTAFEDKKNKKNEKSFSDIEHLAYRLFKENDNIRNEYALKYKEILIDEYQDTNGLQDAIFTSISRENKNIFMVGDLKQSIYRFRGGDPMIFKNKSSLYTDREFGKKIILSQNFRSRREVLSAINVVCGSVMSDEVGDVEYSGDEVLKRDEDRECYADNNMISEAENYSAEFYRVAVIKDNDNDEDVTKERAEAACAAERIRSLIDGHFKLQGKDGKRDIEYRDVVILMRSVKGCGEQVRDVLESYGIPAFVQKEEYFERREIKLMLALISLINNHLQDIPLIAVMRSPIGDFTENELALIKLDYRGKSFYKAVKGYKAGSEEITDEEKRLRSKCRRFIGDLKRWRGYVKMKPIASLIWTLYEETGFYDLMGALEGGEEAQANLKLLYERAKKYEASGFKGIFNFIRYIERMENRNDDISGAKLINESHNVVRIMTIHKSKGLEFPVVFLMNTAKKMAPRRSKGENRVLLHKDLGIGVDYYNYEDMYCKKLMFNEYIKKENEREYLSEELRLMYVAMTRAKEKLIVTSSRMYSDEEEYEQKLSEWKNKYSDSAVSARAAREAKSYDEWIMPAAETNCTYWDCFDKVVSSVAYEDGAEKENEDIVIENVEYMRTNIPKILEFRYKYPQSGAIPAKTSVTEIKEMEDEERSYESNPVYMTQKPKFMREEKLGAQIGTAHHQVMAYINIEELKTIDEKDYENFVSMEIARICREGQIEKDIEEDSEVISVICKNVCGFFESSMGKKLLCAKRVYREKPFEIEISAREYDNSLPEIYNDEKVVVQGIIDLYFEDNNGDITLVDYKTDRCSSKAEQQSVAEKYRKQLEMYGQAVEKILKKSVKEKYLYLFSAQSVVKL